MKHINEHGCIDEDEEGNSLYLGVYMAPVHHNSDHIWIGINEEEHTLSTEGLDELIETLQKYRRLLTTPK